MTSYDESHRPQFHFTAQRNWLNDPNGLLFYAGEYHLFFQHNPDGINWGNMTWGHAVSPDLVHWRQLEHALLPDRLGTMFSGSAVVDWDNSAGFQTGAEKALVAIYTAAGSTSAESQGQSYTQCIAFSNDRGRTWTKYAGNPVLPQLRSGNRDPKVLWHAPSQQWIMTLFLDKADYAFFASRDLKSWQHLQDMTVPGCAECPDFFELAVDGDPGRCKWVWTAANGRYLIGDFDGRQFVQESGPHPADWGRNYYAVQTFSDIPANDGRRIQIAWMSGGAYPGMPFNQQMNFPTELTLHETPDGLRLRRQPVREIALLRAASHRLAGHCVSPGQNPLANLAGDCFEIEADIDLGSATAVGFRCRNETVAYSVADGRLRCLGQTAELPANAARRLRLRILLDRTSLEVFAADGSAVMTSCFLPDPADHSLEFYVKGGAATLLTLAVHELRSAWE